MNDIVDILMPDMDDPGGRRALVESALWGCAVLNVIDWSGANETFTHHLVTTLLKYGDCTPGKPAIVSVLERARAKRGVNWHARFDALINKLMQESTHTQRKGEEKMVTPESAAALLFLLEVGRWAKDELSQRWKFQREQAQKSDEIAELTPDSSESQQIWEQMTRKRSAEEINSILKLIDDNRKLILGYEQSKVNAHKAVQRHGNYLLLENQLQAYDGDIAHAKAEMKRHAGRLGISVEE
jgi:hypothetical protein